MNISEVGLGDLLRVLDKLPEDEWGGAAAALGFSWIRQPERVAVAVDVPALVGRQPEQPSTNSAESVSPPKEVLEVSTDPTPSPSEIPKQRFWRVAADIENPDAQTEAPAWLTQAEVPRIEEFESDPDAARPVVAPLVSAPRLEPFLRRHLTQMHPTGEPDVPRLLRHLTRYQPIRRWPVRQRASWPARVCAVFDARQSLCPLNEDLRAVLKQLDRILGRRLEIHVADDHPPAMPADGRTAVVVLGDAGQGLGDAEVIARWSAWGRHLDRSGMRALMLAPVPPRMVRAEVVGSFDMALLQDDRPQPLRLVGRGGWPSFKASVTPEPVETALRAVLFGHPFVTPEVLRDVRRAMTKHGAQLDVGSELAVWHDPLVVSGSVACMVKPSERDKIQEDWRNLPAQQRAAAVEVILNHLRSASPLVQAEYVRRVGPEFLRENYLAAELRLGIEQADELARRICVGIDKGEQNISDELKVYMARFGRRNRDLIDQGGNALQTAWLLAHRESVQSGDMSLPTGINPSEYAWLIRESLNNSGPKPA